MPLKLQLFLFVQILHIRQKKRGGGGGERGKNTLNFTTTFFSSKNFIKKKVQKKGHNPNTCTNNLLSKIEKTMNIIKFEKE
jgi:hypothetical protein